jgi:hypothetical protein
MTQNYWTLRRAGYSKATGLVKQERLYEDIEFRVVEH